MKVLDLFAGIGGFSLAAHWMGWETVAFVEKDEFCQKVLKKNFGDVPIYGDITTFSAKPFRGRIDIVTAGFPCQPHSYSGQRKSSLDERELWGETARCVGEAMPEWFVGENVAGLLTSESGRFFGRVLRDLDSFGYDAEWHCLPACAFGAPHRRDRVFITAYPKRKGLPGRIFKRERAAAIFTSPRNRSPYGYDYGQAWNGEPDMAGMVHGLPEELDASIALGNAIVPAVALEIFKAIEAAEKQKL